MAKASETGSEPDEAKDEEAEVRLPEPDFDQAEFMEKEVEKGQLAVMNTGYGILLAAVAAVLIPLLELDWKYGWLVLIGGVGGLRLIYRLGGVTTHEWSAKEWLGAYFTLFASFLAFWYVFSNPPFV